MLPSDWSLPGRHAGGGIHVGRGDPDERMAEESHTRLWTHHTATVIGYVLRNNMNMYCVLLEIIQLLFSC